MQGATRRPAVARGRGRGAATMRLEVSNREFCYECNRHVAMTVDIGDLGDQESGAQLCIDCLRAAVALLEEALAATDAAPQGEAT